MILFKTIKDRWVAETPIFFVGVKKVALSLGTSATAIWIVNSTMGLQLSEIVLSGCKYAIAACAAMGMTAQLSKVDNTPK